MAKKNKADAGDLVWAYERASEAKPSDRVTYRVEQWMGVWTPIVHDPGSTRPLGDPCERKQEAKDICNDHFKACNSPSPT